MAIKIGSTPARATLKDKSIRYLVAVGKALGAVKNTEEAVAAERKKYSEEEIATAVRYNHAVVSEDSSLSDFTRVHPVTGNPQTLGDALEAWAAKYPQLSVLLSDIRGSIKGGKGGLVSYLTQGQGELHLRAVNLSIPQQEMEGTIEAKLFEYNKKPATQKEARETVDTEVC